MNTTLARILFVIASLIGGPILLLAASIVVVNFVRGVILLIPSLLRDGDYGYLIHVIPMAIAAAIVYGIVRGTIALARKAVGEPKSYLERDEEHERALRWITIVNTLLVVSLVIAILMSIFLARADVFTLISGGQGPDLIAAAVLTGLYQPLALAAFSLGFVELDLVPSGNTKGRFATGFACIAPPIILIIWLVLQGVTGGLF